MNKTRIKAFTIMEVTVAMLIASLAIAITYSIYTIVVKSYTEYTLKNANIAALTQVDHLLKKDFEQADVIFKTEDGLLCKSADQSIRYEITPDLIIRINITTDTFKVKTQDVNALFENTFITEISDVEEQNRIDELRFNLLFEDRKIPYHYHKQYSSVNLIQRNTNAVN